MTANQPSLLYVGHSYHRVTASTLFLLELLERNFRVTVVWDDSWKPGEPQLTAEQINAFKPEIVLFFQTLPSRRELRRVRCNRIFLVPMHDHVMGNPLDVWPKIRDSGLRVINFCRATHTFFTAQGFESLCVQFWPKPVVERADTSKGMRIFFWPRHQAVGWLTLKTLLGPVRPDHILIRIAPDPGQAITAPSAADVAEYNIQLVEGWLEKDRYLALLAQCNVFMAPRLLEGIGMSFLEAMSYGLAVVAPNAPTMNEYITDGVNGYLYDPHAPQAVDFSSLRSVRERAIITSADGYARWEVQQHELLDYLAIAPRRRKSVEWWLRGLFG